MNKSKDKKTRNAGDARREGKKNIEWRDDPEILQRLALVAELMNKHKYGFEIAMETKVSLETAKRDIARVRELWKEDALDHIKSAKDMALAQYDQIIRDAREDLIKVKSKGNPVRAAYYNVILRAQKQIDAVSGIAEKHELSGPNGGPIPVEVQDMDAVRKLRWKQIAPNLLEIEQEQDAAQPADAEKP